MVNVNNTLNLNKDLMMSEVKGHMIREKIKIKPASKEGLTKDRYLNSDYSNIIDEMEISVLKNNSTDLSQEDVKVIYDDVINSINDIYDDVDMLTAAFDPIIPKCILFHILYNTIYDGENGQTDYFLREFKDIHSWHLHKIASTIADFFITKLTYRFRFSDTKEGHAFWSSLSHHVSDSSLKQSIFKFAEIHDEYKAEINWFVENILDA